MDALHRSTLALAVLCTGCTSAAKQVVPDPTAITLDQAMVSVVQAIRKAETKARVSGTESIGINTCTVEVTFDLTADGKDRNQLVVDASVKAPAAVAVVDAGVTAKDLSR